MRVARFETQLFEAHKGAPPVRLAGRRHGWLIGGTANGVRFDGYIGERNRFFITLDEAVRPAAGVVVGTSSRW